MFVIPLSVLLFDVIVKFVRLVLEVLLVCCER